MPAQTVWRRWIRRSSDELQTLLPTGYDDEGLISAYSDPIQANLKMLEDGKLGLKSVTFHAWQAIILPRQWDDPEKSDPYPEEALGDFANRISKAFNALENNLARLVEGKL